MHLARLSTEKVSFFPSRRQVSVWVFLIKKKPEKRAPGVLFKGKENLKQNQEALSWCHQFTARGSPLHMAVGEDTVRNPFQDAA